MLSFMFFLIVWHAVWNISTKKFICKAQITLEGWLPVKLALKGPACGLLVTCSFHKCLHRLLFFINGIKLSTLKCLDLFSSPVDEALFTQIRKYVRGLDDVSAGCAIITMAICHRRRHRPALHTPQPAPICSPPGLTEIHSSDLVLFICLCFSLIFIILPSARAFPSADTSERFISFATRQI